MNSRIAVISLAWFAFMLIAVASGILREILLAPALGEHLAHQIGTLFVCLLIGLVGIAAIRRLRPTPNQALGIGLAWAIMTVVFEIGVFHFIVGHPMSVLLTAYNLAAGRLWPLVLLTEILTPWLAARAISKRALAVGAKNGLQTLPAEQKSGGKSRCTSPKLLPERYRRGIAREEIASLPIRRYTGETHVVNTAQALADAIRDIRQERVVGFDTETRPAFKKGEDYLPCLVQVATARAVYLLQLEQLDCAQAMAEMLSNPRIVKAGVALAGDIGQLKRLFAFEAAGIVDIGQIAKRHGSTQTGLRNLSALFLGWRITKGARTTNWAAPQLSTAQIGYAATDAWVSRELYLCFQRMGLLAPAEDSTHEPGATAVSARKHSV